MTTSIISGEPRYRLYSASRVGGESLGGLYAGATLQQLRSGRDVYYTYIHYGVRESLDHVLMFQHFYDYSKARIWSFRHMRTLNDHLDEDEREEFTPASDHAPVVVTFDYNPID